jgi:hypothetical protein
VSAHAVTILQRSPRANEPSSALPPLVQLGVLALPHPPAVRPITALAFSPTSSHVALSTTDEKLELYCRKTLLRQEWLQGIADLPPKLELLSGHVELLCFRPEVDWADGHEELGSLLMCSRTMMCHVCLKALKNGAQQTGAGVLKLQRSGKKPRFVGDPPGLATRAMQVEGVVFGGGWVSNDSFLLVQGDRNAALQHMPPPLILRLYGQ